MKRRIFHALVLAAILAAPALAMAALGDMRLDSKLSSMEKAGVGPVVFPHARHEKAFKCAVCHPKIFKDKRGENDISMKKNMDQKFCGSPNCHNKDNEKAHQLYECARCHTNVKAAK
jgi:c(7)-type cytochrome triheme protein